MIESVCAMGLVWRWSNPTASRHPGNGFWHQEILWAASEILMSQGLTSRGQRPYARGREGWEAYRYKKTPPSAGFCVRLELDLPIFIIVKIDPEEVFSVHWCQKYFISFMLFYNTFIVVLHHVSKSVFCFARFRNDECGVHGVRIRWDLKSVSLYHQKRWWCQESEGFLHHYYLDEALK